MNLVDQLGNENPVCVLAGPPGAGKTHLAMTGSQDALVLLFDTENRNEWLRVNRFKDTSMKIAIIPVNSWEDIQTEAQQFGREGNNFSNYYVVFDSMSDIVPMAEKFVKEELSSRGKGFHRTAWYVIHEKIVNMMNWFRNQGSTLIITSQMKEIYQNDQATGKMTPRIPGKIMHYADIVMAFDDKKQEWTYIKNKYARKYSEWKCDADFKTDSITEIIKGLINPKYL